MRPPTVHVRADPDALRIAPPTATPLASIAPTAIETSGLTKTYGRLVAVDGLTIRVPRGRITAFIGPNGAGKTTTIRLLLGLAKPTNGSAFVLGHAISEPATYLPKVGALIEAPAFYPPLSGRRNLKAMARLGGHDARRVDEVLAVVGLTERADDAYRTYSLGMKQRLGIACALLPDPELLILDEPSNGLDPAGIRDVRELLQGLARTGKTVFVSTHLIAEAQRLCDQLIVLRKGKLVFQGTTGEILARDTKILVRTRPASLAPRLASLLRAAGRHAEVDGERLVVHAAASWVPELRELATRAGVGLADVKVHVPDLEESILAMTGGDGA